MFEAQFVWICVVGMGFTKRWWWCSKEVETDNLGWCCVWSCTTVIFHGVEMIYFLPRLSSLQLLFSRYVEVLVSMRSVYYLAGKFSCDREMSLLDLVHFIYNCLDNQTEIRLDYFLSTHPPGILSLPSCSPCVLWAPVFAYGLLFVGAFVAQVTLLVNNLKRLVIVQCFVDSSCLQYCLPCWPKTPASPEIGHTVVPCCRAKRSTFMCRFFNSAKWKIVGDFGLQSVTKEEARVYKKLGPRLQVRYLAVDAFLDYNSFSFEDRRWEIREKG